VNDLDIEGLVGGVLQGVLGSRGKRSHGTLRYLTGGASPFLNASTLLAVAGVAWGLWETAQAQSAVTAAPSRPSVPPPGMPATGGLTVPPPIPADTAPAAAALATPPPIPGVATVTPVTPNAVHPDVLRVLRLTLAAARADGTLEARERDAILVRAKEVGAEPLIAAEVDHPQDLGAIVGDVEDARMRQDLYTLAYAIVRADEHVTAEERSWLTELAGHLRVDAPTVAGLEQQAASRIAAAAQGAER
jgi:uncharacterized membrane protein YebE (DUF533 family)